LFALQEAAVDQAVHLLTRGGRADAERVGERAEVAARGIADGEEDAQLGERDPEVFPDVETERGEDTRAAGVGGRRVFQKLPASCVAHLNLEVLSGGRSDDIDNLHAPDSFCVRADVNVPSGWCSGLHAKVMLALACGR